MAFFIKIIETEYLLMQNQELDKTDEFVTLPRVTNHWEGLFTRKNESALISI